MQIIAFIFGVVCILIGLKSVFTQQATLTIKLWSWGPSNRIPYGDDRGGYTTSEHTGFIAILIGIGQIAMGIGIILKGPAILG